MVNDFQTGLRIALGFTGSMSEFTVNETLESAFFFYPKSLHLNYFVEIRDLIQAEQEIFYAKVFFKYLKTSKIIHEITSLQSLSL